jgi:hypothetical protein
MRLVVGLLLLVGLIGAAEVSAQGVLPYPQNARLVDLAVESHEEAAAPEVGLRLEAGSEGSKQWRGALVGGLIGAGVGYLIGWQWDRVGDQPITPDGRSLEGHRYRTRGAFIGLGAGAMGGFLLGLI